MLTKLNIALLLAAIFCLLAALAHFACIPIGAPAYRFLGAGEAMALMAEQGNRYPDLMSAFIGGVLLIWSAYAIGAAGLFPALPLTKWVLMLIALILLMRGFFGYPLLHNSFPDNSLTFWWISSSICVVMGLTIALGLKQRWADL
jgi:hypothetical protein